MPAMHTLRFSRLESRELRAMTLERIRGDRGTGQAAERKSGSECLNRRIGGSLPRSKRRQVTIFDSEIIKVLWTTATIFDPDIVL